MQINSINSGSVINTESVQTGVVKQQQTVVEGGAPAKKDSELTAQVAQTLSVDEVLTKAGFDPNSKQGLKEAAQLLSNKGYTLTKETLSVLNAFLENEPGTTAEKLQVVSALGQRQLEVTSNQLKSVNAALNGKSLPDIINKIAKELNLSVERQTPAKETVQSARTTDDKLKRLIATVLAKVSSGGNTETEMKQLKLLINQYIKENQNISQSSKNMLTEALSQKGQISRAQLMAILESFSSNGIVATSTELSPAGRQLQTLMKEIQKDPSLTNVLSKVSDFIDSIEGTDIEGIESLKETYARAGQLEQRGRELTARKELLTNLTKIQQENPNLQSGNTTDVSLTAEETNAVNAAIANLKLDSRDIIVTTITKKLSQMAIDFKSIRLDITKNLDQASRLTMQSSPQASQVLESTIKQLDNAILKGEFMLYTDMETEKQLLVASSRLAEAKKLLVNGQQTEVRTIIKEVKDSIGSIIFKPADVKVKHFVSQQSIVTNNSDTGEKQFDQLYQSIGSGRESSRDMLESIRKWGYMYENDAAKALVSQGQPSTANLKAALMRLAQVEGNQQLASNADQALTNLNGQQLLNKQDSNGIQNMAFQLPVLLNKEVENLNVFINSQNKKDTIDWENCSLYFVMETKKLGEIGIQLTATNRNVFITCKSDKEDLPEAIKPLTESTKVRLQEIGYNMGSLQFKPFSLNESKPKTTLAQSSIVSNKPNFSGEGYDFSV